MAYPVCEVFLTRAPLLTPAAAVPVETGAVVDFWGVVRGMEAGEGITGIDYEAHATMAEHQLRIIAEEAAKRFDLRQITISHRVGFVPAGEASLLVRVGTGHRAAAFRAIESVVDELKKRTPIWKHPQFSADSSSRRNASKSVAEFAHSKTP